MSIERVCIIEPFFTNYRLPVYRELSRHCRVDWVCSRSPAESGFGNALCADAPGLRCIEMPTRRLFGANVGMIQGGLIKYVVREKPDVIMASANPNYLSFWTTLLLARLKRIPFYVHGHGFWKRRRASLLRRLAMRWILRMVTSYIAYAPAVRESLCAQGIPTDKVSVAHNTLVNPFPVRPEERNGEENGILFLGRLRRDCGVSLLMRVLRRLREEDGFPMVLHVIGAGEEAEKLRLEAAGYSWVVWHGEVYDPLQIRAISLECFLGCYPGDVGLSVVHMMSLSLPVLIHDDMTRHGPESSFIRDGSSGIFFNHRNLGESLQGVLRALQTERSRVAEMQRSAFEDYQSLVNPSLAERLWAILSAPCAISAGDLSAARL